MPAKNYLRERLIADARAADPAAIYYQSSTPCRAKGHLGLRYISTYACKECHDARNALLRDALASIRRATPSARGR